MMSESHLQHPSHRSNTPTDFTLIDPEIKSIFDQLLFNSDHVLLEALTQTLVTQSTTFDSIHNTRTILRYYYNHNKLIPLMLWAFEKELTNKAQDAYNFHFTSNSLFLKFYKEYVHIFLNEYLCKSMKPILEKLFRQDSRRLSLTGNKAVFEQEMNFTNTEDYRTILQFLVRLISTFNDNLTLNTSLLPTHFSQLIQSLSAVLKAHRLNKRDVIKTVFRQLFYDYTITPVIINPENILPKMCPRDIVANKYKLEFFKETLEKMHSNDCLTQDNYLFEIMPLISNPDPSSDIISYLLLPNSFTQQPIDNILCHQYFNQFIDTIRENILVVIDCLPRRICDTIIQIVNVDQFVLDDYQLYRAFLDSANVFNEDYNVQMSKSAVLFKKKKSELLQAQSQFDKLEQSLESIQQENIELQAKLDSLRSSHSLPPSEERYAFVPFNMYYDKHCNTNLKDKKRSDYQNYVIEDKSKAHFGIFKRNRKK
ncbi:Ras-GAP domain-containing protein [Entamoeba marina]